MRVARATWLMAWNGSSGGAFMFRPCTDGGATDPYTRATPQTVALDGTYVDTEGQEYTGSITLPAARPNSSLTTYDGSPGSAALLRRVS